MWGKRRHGDFQAEIEAHLQLEADRLQSEGLPPAEAGAAARRAFGNRTRAEERYYESGRWMFLDNLARDIRFAARMLGKDLRFSILSILGLALGIALSTIIFALVNASFGSQRGAAGPESRLSDSPGSSTEGDGRLLLHGVWLLPRSRHRASRGLRRIGAGTLLMARGIGRGRRGPGTICIEIYCRSPDCSRRWARFSLAEEQPGAPRRGAPRLPLLEARDRVGPSSAGQGGDPQRASVTIIGLRRAPWRRRYVSFYLPLGLQPALMSTGAGFTARRALAATGRECARHIRATGPG